MKRSPKYSGYGYTIKMHTLSQLTARLEMDWMVPWFGGWVGLFGLVVMVTALTELRALFTVGKLSQNNYTHLFVVTPGIWHELNCMHK